MSIWQYFRSQRKQTKNIGGANRAMGEHIGGANKAIGRAKHSYWGHISHIGSNICQGVLSRVIHAKEPKKSGIHIYAEELKEQS